MGRLELNNSCVCSVLSNCCHVEIVSSLDIDGFLNAVTRMVPRRDSSQDMLSNNGTNFMG